MVLELAKRTYLVNLEEGPKVLKGVNQS
jgi:hypothetical protein